MVNFTACHAIFLNNATNLELYGYSSTASNTPGQNHSFITTAGCRKLCGSGSDFYPWDVSSDSIVTWVIPMLVMFLLAPFEPNQTRNNFQASIRWLGSPFVSLAYVLRNIKASGRCAEMVDMAVGFDEYPPDGSDFGHFRDAMTILACMNQYMHNESFAQRRGLCAEQLLRVALFADISVTDKDHSLLQIRTKLAASIRAKRRRGVVPIFIGLLWFLFVFAISVQFTFEDIGENTAAHNLAMGFSLCWIVPLVIGAVVDRNPTAHKDLLSKFNKLVANAHVALQDAGNIEKVLQQRGEKGLENARDLLCETAGLDIRGGFFIEFAGQGRIGWHRGVMYPILAGIESGFVASYGRGWLDQQPKANKACLTPASDHGFSIFEPDIVSHLAAAFRIVYGTLCAAFLISFFTPPIGLGCRAGGFMVYAILTFAAAVIELAIEAVAHLQQRPVDTTAVWYLLALQSASVSWLIYITLAQTFGIYQTCTCLGQLWGSRGGYTDFGDDPISDEDLKATTLVWSVATAIAGTILLIMIKYVVDEWCLQSHLMTSNYRSAMRGLSRTRRYRRVGRWINMPYKILAWCVEAPVMVPWMLLGRKSASARLQWTVSRRPLKPKRASEDAGMTSAVSLVEEDESKAASQVAEENSGVP